MFDGRAVRRRTTDDGSNNGLSSSSNSLDLHNSQEVRTSSLATGASHSHQSMSHTYSVPSTSAASLSRKRGMDQLLQIPQAQDPCSLAASAAISPATPLAVPGGATKGAAATAAAAKTATTGHGPSAAHVSSTWSEAQRLQQPVLSPSAPATPHMAAGAPCNPAPAMAPSAAAAPGGADVHLSRPADSAPSAGSFTGAAVTILQRRKDPTRTVTSEIVWAPRGGSITQERPPASPAVSSWLAAASSAGSGSFTQALEEFNAAEAAAAEGAAGAPPSLSPAAATCSNAAPGSSSTPGHACLQTAGSSVPLIPAPRMMEQQDAALVTPSAAEPAAVVEAGHGGAGAADAHDCKQCVAPCSHCKTSPVAAAAAAAAAVAVDTEGGALASSSCSTAGADTATITSCEGAQSEDDMEVDLSVEHLQHSHEHLPDLDRWEGSWWGDVLQGEEETGVAAALLGEPLHVMLPQLLSLQALGSELQLDGE